MYKNYNVAQLTFTKETSVLILTNDMSRHVNIIAETIPSERRQTLGDSSPKLCLYLYSYF
ncbi:hypothetical protein CW744_12620 [Staphylococcus xylosus]|nr:hypothetical protein CW744_12620 [Staphylococcus xylosus]